MFPKLLKLKAKDAIKSGATTISSNGSVTLRKTCHGPPPSTLAASLSSVGIDCRAPSEIRKKYGEVNQTLTRITETLAQFESKSHGMSVCRSLLTTPKSSFRSPCQTRSDRKPGIAYGRTSSTRYVRRKFIPGLSSVIARSSPRTKEISTARNAKANVQTKTRRNGSRTRGLWRILSKLAHPMFVFQPG